MAINGRQGWVLYFDLFTDTIEKGMWRVAFDDILVEVSGARIGVVKVGFVEALDRAEVDRAVLLYGRLFFYLFSNLIYGQWNLKVASAVAETQAAS